MGVSSGRYPSSGPRSGRHGIDGITPGRRGTLTSIATLVAAGLEQYHRKHHESRAHHRHRHGPSKEGELIESAARSGASVFITQNGYARQCSSRANATTSCWSRRREKPGLLLGGRQGASRSPPPETGSWSTPPYGVCDLEFTAFLGELGFDPRSGTLPE